MGSVGASSEYKEEQFNTAIRDEFPKDSVPEIRTNDVRQTAQWVCNDSRCEQAFLNYYMADVATWRRQFEPTNAESAEALQFDLALGTFASEDCHEVRDEITRRILLSILAEGAASLEEVSQRAEHKFDLGAIGALRFDTAAGGLGVGLVMLVAARLRPGSGVGFVMEAIVLGRVRVPLQRSSLQAIASWLAIASGNSLGREGPLIQFGAAAGEGARRVFALDNVTARIVLAAGVAAGFASAYNAPVAAVLFVVEIVTGVVVLEAIVPMLIAVVIATVATRYVVGGSPLYGMRSFGLGSPAELVAFAGLGLVAAPVGVGFLRLLGLADKAWHKIPMPWRPALGGLACGAILIGLHAAFGDVVGSPPIYTLVGLAAAMAATTHAPLTGAVLACELSGDYALVLPLLVATAVAAGWARRLYVDSVYTAELSRRGLRWRLTLDGRRVIESQQDAVDVV